MKEIKNKSGKRFIIKRPLRFCAAAVAALAIAVSGAAAGQAYGDTLPTVLLCEAGTTNVSLQTALPVSAKLSGQPREEAGNMSVNLSLFGLFDIKQTKVEYTERPMLIPCGSPFGIKMLTAGVIVTDFGTINGASPARDAGVQIGDNILRVNGLTITSNADIARAVQANRDSTAIYLERAGVGMTFNIEPVKTADDESYRIGVWVRDSTAGIGTVTYYDPDSGIFGGLGHGVCDADTGQMLPLAKGEAVSVAISSVVKGKPGLPGELCGAFLSNAPIGIIEANTESGVFGTMTYPPSLDDAIPMAFKQEVEPGPATVLTTLYGSSPKEYAVMIEKIDYNEKSKVKNMILRVTDPELLSQTGGIVQGMSGSPILQNGRLCGAVTHVFVGDCTRGYAIFAENMRGEQLTMNDEQSLPAA